MLSPCNICALLWSLVKFGTARHHDNSGTIAKHSRHNPESVQFLEASTKQHALFGDTETEECSLLTTLKSRCVTRWSCRWEAVKAVDQQLERIVKALLVLFTDRDTKTCSESRSLVHGICDFQFVLGLWV